MRRVLFLAGAVLLGLASVAALPEADGPGPRPSRPSILLVTLDTTRADHTSAYGYSRPTTPRLAKLVEQGVRFDVAYAPMATTLPSHATMFSALLPRTHGALKNGIPLDSSVPLLAEVLANNGYRTAAFVSSFAVDSTFGLERGFATYDDQFGTNKCKFGNKRWEGRKIEGEFCRRGDVTRARAVEWLRSNGYLGTKAEGNAEQTAPFFVWVHLFDAHNPYAPPEANAALFPPVGENPTELEREIAAYDGEINFADQEMGKLVDALAEAGRLDDTLVIVVGDHGEGLMQHGWMLHGLQIYEEAVRVPFVVRWPRGVRGGRTVAEPVHLSDLAPTVLDLAGVGERLPREEGQSLASVLTGDGRLDAERPIFLQRRFYASRKERGVPVKGDKSAVRMGAWKYIEAPEEKSFELYDLAKDPGETRNVHDAEPARVAALAETLRAWVAKGGTTSQPRGVSEEDARRLEALGYVQ